MGLSAPLLAALLAPPAAPAACPDVATWWARHRAAWQSAAAPIEASIGAGLRADRAGWAFASAYQAALRALLPELPDDAVAALCVTEAAGNAPRQLRTTIRDDGAGGLVIDGHKRWTTLGPASGLLLVAAVAADGAPAPHPTVRVVRVPGDAPGVRLQAMPATRFVPEVPHAEVSLHRVRVDASAVLPGDGWTQVVKPFRTVEDIHVSAALLACRYACMRRHDGPVDWCERALVVLGAFADLAARDPRAPATHLLLAGTLSFADALFAQADAHCAGCPADDELARWTRDAPLLKVASAVRPQRTARAWQQVALRSCAGPPVTGSAPAGPSAAPRSAGAGRA